MRILIISQYFWPENFRVNELATGLVRREHQVVVLTGIPNYPSGRVSAGYGWFKKTRENYQGVEVIRVPLMPRGKGGAFRLLLNYLSFVFFASVLGPFVCRGEYDAIFVHQVSPATVGIPAAWLKWLKKAPLCFWVLDLWPETLSASGLISSPAIVSMTGWMMDWIYARSDRILASSRAFIPKIAERGVPEQKLYYLPNWAENVYRPPAQDKEAELKRRRKGDSLRVMFAGSIGVAQDFGTILAAAEILKSDRDIQWLIVGEGRMSQWAREQAAARGLRESINFLGHHPIEEMPKLFAQADIMLVSLKPEPTFALTVPAKIQAYLACAKPIIAMLDGEGARIVMESGAGIACPAGDARALAEAVKQMRRKTYSELSDMGSRGNAYSKRHFDREVLLDRLDSWLREMSGSAPIVRTGHKTFC